MFHLVILFASIFAASATQDCYSCTSAVNYDMLKQWNWSSNWNGNPSSNYDKSGNDFCDLHPWELGDAGLHKNCPSMCFKWQFTYSDPKNQTRYATVRGCGQQMLNNLPNQETPCPPYTNSVIQTNSGPIYGTARTCFCNGVLCNPATKIASFGIGTMMILALITILYH